MRAFALRSVSNQRQTTNIRLTWHAVLIALACCLAACAALPDAPTGWPVTTVAQAPQTGAPALWLAGGRVFTGWIGADEAGIHHDARPLDGGTPGEMVVLPLPPTHPYDLTAVGGHLLWLDAGEGGNRLYTALITPDLRVRRGPTEVSGQPTYHYAAAIDGQGGVWTAWSGGLAAEPALYVQRIDSDGRPLQAQKVALNAAWPALARSEGGVLHLFWLERETGDLWHARQRAGAWNTSGRLSVGVRLLPGDRPAGASAAIGGSTGYLVLNLTRADGADESWLASGDIDAANWNRPQRLTYSVGGEEQPLRWSAVAARSGEAALAAEANGAIRLFAPAGGTLGDGQLVAGLARELLGPAALQVDNAGRWFVSWSEPNDAGTADLKVAREPHPPAPSPQ